jgi:hypothetical protein
MHAVISASMMVLVLLGSTASAQTTKEAEPSLSNDERKPQQNSADEAAIKGRLEDGLKPGGPSEQSEANKKLEDAAVEAKRKSDGNTSLQEKTAVSVDNECSARFKAADANNDGVLTRTEIANARQLPAELAKEVLVGRQEFLAACAKMPSGQAQQ